MNKWITIITIINLLFGKEAIVASVSPTEVANLSSDRNLGGGSKIGSQLIAATYNPGDGPGIWVVADGGFRLFLNGELLAEDNQAGRGHFIPLTFLPGENAVSVVAFNGQNKPGVMVQIDELDRSYYSDSSWYAKSSISNDSWKNKGRNLSQWGRAATLSYSNTKLPSGGTIFNFAKNTNAKWIWTGNENDKTAILLFTFYIKAEGYGANTTGGEGGKIVIVRDYKSIISELQNNEKKIILVAEGTYDFRKRTNAVTEANSKGRTWCRRTCTETNKASRKINKYYRISFQKNSCASLGEKNIQIVKESDKLEAWSNWITTKANKSLIGMGRGANLRGASIVVRSNEGSFNHIYRNLAIYDVNPHLIEAGDGLETVGTNNNHVKNFWADHISYKWISDGMDMEYLDKGTISYLDFDGGNDFNCWGEDPYMALVEDAELTYANNYWHNTYGRVPKVTGEQKGSRVHLYNQYVDKNSFFIAGATGHSNNAKAYVLYENNYINDGTGYLAEIGDNGFVNFSGVKFGGKTVQQYRQNGSVKKGIPSMQSFNPGYKFVKMDVNKIPTEIPKIVGVGGRFGKMPDYNQAAVLSSTAPKVSLTSPKSSTYEQKATISFTIKVNEGKVTKVDYYIGTSLVGSSNRSPYEVKVSNIPGGTYSALAIAYGDKNIWQMSEYVTFNVKGGSGSTSNTGNTGNANTKLEKGLVASYKWDNNWVNSNNSKQKASPGTLGKGKKPAIVVDNEKGHVLEQYFGVENAKTTSYTTMPNPLKGSKLTGATISVWVKKADDNVYDALWAFTSGNLNKINGRLYFTGNSYLGFNDGKGNWFDLNHPDKKKTNAIPRDKWTQVTTRIEANRFFIYINGAKIYANNIYASYDSSKNFNGYQRVLDFLSSAENMNLGIGSFWGSAPAKFENLVVYNRALSEAEIIELYK